jgi:hypothetical protein
MSQMATTPTDLPALFSRVAQVLEGQRETLNQADAYNHDHGDHMVLIFTLASRAAAEMSAASLPEAMQHASHLLVEQPDNDSAQVYARGLDRLAVQLRQRQLTLEDLLFAARSYLREPGEAGEAGEKRTAEVGKALLAALAEWSQVEASLVQGETGPPGGGLDMGYMFGVGMAYLQAKQKGGSRLDVLSETVASASPLGKVPYRHQSGVIAIKALVEAMGEQSN